MNRLIQPAPPEADTTQQAVYILPELIPLLITLGIYVLIKKGWTPVKCIILILVAVSALFCSSERTIPITNVTRNG